MSIKKIERISKVDSSRSAMHKWGVNLFEKSECKVINRNTGATPDMKARRISVGDCLLGNDLQNYLSDKVYTSTKDIMSDKVDIIYDLGKTVDINKIYMKGFFDTNTNYSLAEFEIYASETEDTLFNGENIIVSEKPENEWHKGCSDMAEWLYEVEGEARYIAIRIVKSNATDDITRINYIGAYSYTETKKRRYIIDKRDMSILKGFEPKTLTDGLIYDKTVAVKGEETFNFALKEKTAVNYIWVIAKSEFVVEVNGFALEKTALLEEGRKEILLRNDSATEVENIAVTVKGDCEIDQIGAYSNKRYMKIDFEDVICDDFFGIGACVVPCAMMPESRAAGFNEVYWEMEKSRIDKTRPHVVRSWFQLDWVVDNYDDYKNGNYHFDSEKMEAMYYHFDAYKESGVEIEFNFGWKIPVSYAEWFGFPDMPDPRITVPRELDLFAKCCVATLKHLIEDKGYDNIKYLTFYNEPTGGDFNVDGSGYSKMEYWSMMLNECYKAVEESGLDVKFWGPEIASECYEHILGIIGWMDYLKENSPNKLDVFTFHRYSMTEEVTLRELSALMGASRGLPIMLSECGQNYAYNDDQSWKLNNIQLFCNLTQCGFSGALVWCLVGVVFTEPLCFTMQNTIDMWDVLCLPGGIATVREPFYEWAMLSRYIPNHWKSVKSSVLDNAGENRIAAFTDGEDYTVVVEVKDSALNRDIEVEFNKTIGKKFYKHCYKIPYCRDGNAIIPPVCGEIYADDTLKDTVNSGYQAIVYTTLSPVTQIRVGTPELELVPNQKFTLSGEIIDGEGNIIWEKTKEIGNSITVGLDGTVIASEDAKSGDMCAVKAYSEEKPEAYTIVIVKIK